MKVNGNIEFYTLGQGEIQNAIIERMTTSERNAASHVDGRIVFDTDAGMYYYSHSGAWREVTTSDSFTISDGSNTDSVTLEEAFVFSASDGLVTTVTDNNVTVSLSNDPTITLTGAVDGDGTITDLGDVTINTSIQSDLSMQDTYYVTNLPTIASGDPSHYAATKGYVDDGLAAQDELSELNDTNFGGPVNGNVVYYNGSNWVDQTLTASDLSDVNTTGVSDRHLLSYDSGASEWSVQFERYDITFGYPGTLPAAGNNVHLFSVPQLGTEQIHLADPSTTASAQSQTPAGSSSADIGVYRNGSLLVTLSFAATSTTPTYTNNVSFPVELAANDLITFEVDATDDGSFADFSITLVGELV